MNIKWLIVAVLFTAAVVFLAYLPEEAMPSPLCVRSLDKLVHTLAYAAITFLFILSLRTCIAVSSASLLFLFLAILAIGTLDELTQPFVMRPARLTDWLANITGILAVLVPFVFINNLRRQISVDTGVHPMKSDT